MKCANCDAELGVVPSGGEEIVMAAVPGPHYEYMQLPGIEADATELTAADIEGWEFAFNFSHHGQPYVMVRRRL